MSEVVKNAVSCFSYTVFKRDDKSYFCSYYFFKKSTDKTWILDLLFSKFFDMFLWTSSFQKSLAHTYLWTSAKESSATHSTERGSRQKHQVPMYKTFSFVYFL